MTTPLEGTINKLLTEKLNEAGFLKASDFSARFSTRFAEESLVKDFKTKVQDQIKEWQKSEDAEHVSTGNVALKAESTGVTFAGNIAKIEGNLFALQADAIRVDAVVKDFVLNRLETKRTVDQLKALKLVGQEEAKKDAMSRVDPVNLLKKILEVETAAAKQTSLAAVQQKVNGTDSGVKDIQKLLRLEPELPEVRRKIGKLEKSSVWAKDRIDKLTGSRDPAKDQTAKRRGEKAVPNVHQLERQEKQLRQTIVRFVRLIEMASPEMKSFSSQINRIERELQK
jgi:hypothetical protein